MPAAALGGAFGHHEKIDFVTIALLPMVTSMISAKIVTPVIK